MNSVNEAGLTRDQRKQLLIETKAYAEEKKALSWWHLISTIVLFFVCFTVAAMSYFPWYVRLIAGGFAGLVNVRLFIIYHDYQHGTILRDSIVARILMTSYGCIFLNPPSIWKYSHDHHHQNNSKMPASNIGSFPLLTTENFKERSMLEKFGYLFVRHPINMVLGYLTVFLIGTTILPFFRNPVRHVDAGIAAIVHITMLVLFLVFAWQLALFAFLIPFLVAGAIGSYLFYAQHNFPEVHVQFEDDWDYVDAALKSSSFIKMSPVMHWFTGNIGYHHVHHLNHKIPFYRLHEAMSGIKELQNPLTTTLMPWDMFRCVRLKLWDPKLQKLVPLSGLRRSS